MPVRKGQSPDLDVNAVPINRAPNISFLKSLLQKSSHLSYISLRRMDYWVFPTRATENDSG